MKPLALPTALAGLLACALATLAAAAEPGYGEREFRARCAMCHGASGQGNGWMAEQLIQRPANLRLLKKNNGGTFPRERVAQIVDGRIALKAHGPTEMPAWGPIYRADLEAAAGGRRGVREEDEVIISYRIRALVDYVSTLQE